MKIIIENEHAETAGFGKEFHSPSVNGTDVFVDIAHEQQQQSQWCWAAIGAMLGRYYGANGSNQEKLAATVLNTGTETKRGRKKKTETNVSVTLDRALKHIGCYSHWSLGRPLPERVMFEINQGRPVCVRVEWYQGGAHYVLLKGYNAATEEWLVEDPMDGPSRVPFAAFPQQYGKSGGVWTDTFWTRPHE